MQFSQSNRGVTILGGQLVHLTAGRTWLFYFVWGGGHPQLKGGGVWAPCQLGPALPQPPPCQPCRPNTHCTHAVGPAPQWLQSTAQTPVCYQDLSLVGTLEKRKKSQFSAIIQGDF